MRAFILAVVAAGLAIGPALAEPATAEQTAEYHRQCMGWGLGEAQCTCRTDVAAKQADAELMAVVNAYVGQPVAEKYQAPMQAVFDQVYEMCKSVGAQ